MRTLSAALLAVLTAHLPFTAASPGAPTVTLDNGTFTGGVDGPTHHFLGIPYAQPPYALLPFPSVARARF